MIQSNNLLQNKTDDPYLKMGHPTNIPFRDLRHQKFKDDSIAISKNSPQNMVSLTSKPAEQITYNVQSSNINIQYNFTNSLIQVQSKGNYNIKSQSGSLNININLTRVVEDNPNSMALPFKMDISLNFSIVDKQINNERGTKTVKPDIKVVIQNILERLFTITQDGQNKNVFLAFENDETLRDLAAVEKGEVLRMIYNYLGIIAQMNNPQDEDGKRDMVTLLIDDQTKKFDYEKREMTISMSNINLELSFDSAEMAESFLTNIGSMVNQT